MLASSAVGEVEVLLTSTTKRAATATKRTSSVESVVISGPGLRVVRIVAHVEELLLFWIR